MQHHQQLPAQIPGSFLTQLQPPEAPSLPQQQQQGHMQVSESHSVSRLNSSQAPQQQLLGARAMVVPGSTSAQPFAGFGSQANLLHQSHIPKGLPPQPQQLQQRPSSHHLAPQRNTMQQQQQGRSQVVGHMPSGSAHAGTLPLSYVPTDASAQPGRVPQITADHPVTGQSTHQPPPSLPAGSKDSLLARPSSTTGANCSTDGVQRDKAAENVLVANINDRKVRLASDSDSTSLYALCRRWVRNDVPRKDQPGLQNFVKLLPKPLPSVKAEEEDSAFQDNGKKDSCNSRASSELQAFLEGPVEALSEHDLLQSHIKHFKDVRKRSREEQMKRIGRYKQRLALLLHPSPHQNKADASIHF